MNVFDERIVGYEYEKTVLRKIVDMLKNPAEYEGVGNALSKGLLLVSPPGTGKTTLAECLIEESGREAVILRKKCGDNQFLEEIGRAYEKAAEAAPAVVLLDDIDKYGDDIHDPAWVTIQACIDENAAKGVFTVATANDTDDIAESLLRPGRFDVILNLEKPIGKDAEDIIRFYLEGKELAEDVELDDFCRLLSGQNCAALETAVNLATMNRIFDRTDKIHRQHLLEAVLTSVFGLKEPDYKDRDMLRHIAFHEASHVLVAEMLCPGIVSMATVRRDGRESGGCIRYGEKPILDMKMHEKFITIAMAGKAGVKLRFGIDDFGSSDDVQESYDNAVRMVSRFGVAGFAGIEGSHRGLSEALYQRTEDVSAGILERCYSEAMNILTMNMGLIEKIADALIEKDTLLSSDIRALMGEKQD